MSECRFCCTVGGILRRTREEAWHIMFALKGYLVVELVFGHDPIILENVLGYNETFACLSDQN